MSKNTDQSKQSLIHDVSGSSKRHKWNGKASNLFAVYCLKCGCVKEIVKGTVIYFKNDSSYLRSPNCY